MSNVIQHKRNSAPGVIPAATGIQQGELAINIGDGKFYTKDSGNNIINLGVTSISGTYITPASGNFNYLAVSGVPVSVSGHSHLMVPQAQSLVTTVFNKTASTIPKFSIVYINGGQGDQPTVQLAIGNGEIGSSNTYAITAEAISSMSTGSVIVAGALSGINTDQFNPTAPTGDVNGVTLYLSPSVSGAATTTKPYAPNHLVSIGNIVRTHQNEGIVEVKIQNGFELQELHNVAVTGATNGQFLQYNSGSVLWVPSSSGNFTSLSVNNTGVSLSGHTHTSSNITDFASSVSGLLPVGTANYLSKFGTGGSGLSNSLIYDDGTNVGIGIASPSEKLDINGTLKTLGFKSYGIGWFGASDGSVGLGVNDNPSGTFGSSQAFTALQGFNDAVSSYNPICLTTQYDAQLYLNTDGNVGIGTATPLYKLDVNGTIGDSTNGAISVQDLNISNITAGTISIDAATNNLSISGDGTITIASAVDQQLDINSNVTVQGDITLGVTSLSESELLSIINSKNIYMWSNYT